MGERSDQVLDMYLRCLLNIYVEMLGGQSAVGVEN